MAAELNELPVMLSASLPSELAGTVRAQDFYDAIVVFVESLLSSGGRLIFGGHPTVTPLVHQVAKSVAVGTARITLFQAEVYRHFAPDEIYDREVFGDVRWSRDLNDMREDMVQSSQAAVFIGGQPSGFSGPRPGIRDEFDRFLRAHPEGPAYVLGLLGGEAGRIIRDLDSRGTSEPNHLQVSERKLLHRTDSVDLAASLVLKDLASVAR